MALLRVFVSSGLLFLICHAMAAARDLPESAQINTLEGTITAVEAGRPICRRHGCPPASQPPPPPTIGKCSNNDENQKMNAANSIHLDDGRDGYNGCN
ncbi:unnamed protein product [Cuscuta campestris]|uniref:Rapid ALkalinization Factor n=2 Tax=Cuscuta sect. Cleistogrammica TaxID=1824901 RepID=A0A484N8B1_9ASTE|nr:hypothetical protein DM860_014951 [Cuscuta australis]VFQ97290.1 unnamed protein product [Cuscuta campestris]